MISIVNKVGQGDVAVRVTVGVAVGAEKSHSVYFWLLRASMLCRKHRHILLAITYCSLIAIIDQSLEHRTQ